LEDLSLHILDVVENSICAGATRIEITISEDRGKNELIIKIKDNGEGIGKKAMARILDPFYTTKEKKRIGLGLSMLAQAAREAEGHIKIKSKKKIGTTVIANFRYDHIDRKPIGNMADTIIGLFATHASAIRFIYQHKKDGKSFVIDTRRFQKLSKGMVLTNPFILKSMKREFSKGMRILGKKGA
jgi:hypothetical protein